MLYVIIYCFTNDPSEQFVRTIPNNYTLILIVLICTSYKSILKEATLVILYYIFDGNNIEGAIDEGRYRSG